MLMGIRLQARPTNKQKKSLSQWMGCARFVWNAKCQEDKYLSTFAQKYMAIGTYAPFDQKYSQYKDRKLSPFLFECPSQILRNSASNWFSTYKDFLKARSGKPKFKRKDSSGSIHLTKELFSFESDEGGRKALKIGTKKFDIGVLDLNYHRDFKEPKSLYIKKKAGSWWVSFCYDDDLKEEELIGQKEHLKYLSSKSKEDLLERTIGIDRGIARPVQAGSSVFDFTDSQKRSKSRKERYLKKYQRRLSRQKKGSKRRERTKTKIAKSHQKISAIRKDFCHKTTSSLVKSSKQIFILEDLKTSNMTRRAKPKRCENTGSYKSNRGRAKSGLNKAILDKGWHQIELFLSYKTYRAGKVMFKVPAFYTSQECANCSHTHPDNRKSQSIFSCVSCGYRANADENAALVISKRAINLIKDSGTELSKRGVLLGSGCGAISKTRRAKASSAGGKEASKKTRKEVALAAA